jgi:hypothetical protein
MSRDGLLKAIRHSISFFFQRILSSHHLLDISSNIKEHFIQVNYQGRKRTTERIYIA